MAHGSSYEADKYLDPNALRSRNVCYPAGLND